ncbi:MAG TPA: ABC transporter, partial [Gammaproteobacteria bacterium]|nr:ABC transporter [Gammaproteobacteria bacterium]
HSLEVKVPNGKLINEVFKELDKQGLEISSMRNKTNRLEQLFLSRLRNNGND